MDQKSCANQEDERHCNLRGDQHRPHSLALTVTRRACSAGVSAAVEVVLLAAAAAGRAAGACIAEAPRAPTKRIAASVTVVAFLVKFMLPSSSRF